MCLDPAVCNNMGRQRKRQKTMGMIKVSTSVVKIYGIFTVFLKTKFKSIYRALLGKQFRKFSGNFPSEQIFYRNIRLGPPVVISGLLLFHRSRGHYCLTLIYLNKLFIATEEHDVRVESF